MNWSVWMNIKGGKNRRKPHSSIYINRAACVCLFFFFFFFVCLSIHSVVLFDAANGEITLGPSGGTSSSESVTRSTQFDGFIEAILSTSCFFLASETGTILDMGESHPQTSDDVRYAFPFGHFPFGKRDEYKKQRQQQQ